MRSPPALVLVAGLPGTGKSTIAGYLSRGHNLSLLAKDVFESALLPFTHGKDPARDDPSWISYDAYSLMTRVASHLLETGLSVLVDGVLDRAMDRASFLEIADKQCATVHIIECVCSDPQLHRRRLDHRTRTITDWHVVTWDRVQVFRGRYTAWQSDRLVLDSARTLSANLAAADTFLARLGSNGDPL